MKTNIGEIDRTIRLMIGMVLLVGGVMLNSWAGLVGVAFLASGILDRCPIYSLLRIRRNGRGSNVVRVAR